LTTAILAALGALFGNLSGSALSGFFSYPQSVGALVGSIIGAFIPVFFSIYLAQHKKLRLALLALVGTAFAVDTVIGVIKLGSLSTFLGGKKSSWFKRLFMYLAAFLILLLVKGKEELSLDSYDREVFFTIKYYLDFSASLVSVLLYRIKSRNLMIGDDNSKLLSELVPIIKKLIERDTDNHLVQELKRKLMLSGFEMESPLVAETSLKWSESLKERYDTFGYVKMGEMVSVEEEPIVKNGMVLRKGQVVPL
jgi:MFS family permease